MTTVLPLFAIILVLAYLFIVGYQSYLHNRDEPEVEEWDEEWDCPDCGFHVQAGPTCIYCGASMPVSS
ncbi:MAG: hypothetical protein V3U35_05410 [Candidatus Neomarinimicrobiota bacterium]